MERQLGFSLIEMMLSMVLGLIVAGSVLQLAVNNNRSTKTNEYLSLVQQSGRHALYVLSSDLRMAGYKSNHSGSAIMPFYLGSCEGDSVCTTDGGGINNDRIAVQYEPANSFDCTGDPVITAGSIIANVYFIDLDRSHENIYALFCRSYDVLSEMPRGDAIPLVHGVEKLQILYGLTTTGSDNVNQYMTASSIVDWSDVKSVRIAFLVGSGFESKFMDVRTRKYNLLESGDQVFTDNIPRFPFSTAIHLNNSGI